LDSFEYINSSAMWIQILTLLTEKKFTDWGSRCVCRFWDENSR
jgi:hypothetical protein